MATARVSRFPNSTYESLSILTDVATDVMLAVEAEIHMPFVHIVVVKISWVEPVEDVQKR
jgi:hypothetical protein